MIADAIEHLKSGDMAGVVKRNEAIGAHFGLKLCDCGVRGIAKVEFIHWIQRDLRHITSALSQTRVMLKLSERIAKHPRRPHRTGPMRLGINALLSRALEIRPFAKV